MQPPEVLTCGGSGRMRPLQLAQKLVASPRAFGVLSHYFVEERLDIVQTRVLCITHVLAVIVPRLQRVILKGNKIECHVVETRFTRCHVATSLIVSANLV